MLLRPMPFVRFAFAPLLLLSISAAAQSGRGLMHGFVGYDDISYDEMTHGVIHAKVELRGATANNHARYAATTDDRGLYDSPAIGAGEYTLTITAPGHATYRIDVYIPSDFECRLATMLKKKIGSGAH
jgi:hypothetical protein